MKTRRILAAAFIAAAVILASIRSGTLVYSLLYLSILMPLLSVLYVYVVYGQMKIIQRIESRSAVKDQPVGYVCRLVNETRFLPFTRIELQFHSELSEISGVEEKRTFTLAAGQSDEIRTELICRRRGRYAIGVEKIFISDVLGLFRMSFDPPVEYPVSVYPRVLHLNKLGVFSFEGVSAADSADMYETTAGDTLREYTAGDDPRLIHWKATARTGKMQVRQVCSIERPAMMIVVDTRKYENGTTAIIREDNLIETLLSMCDYCLLRGIDVDVYAGDDCFLVRNTDDFNELYDWSCHMEFSRLAEPVCIPDVSFTCCALLAAGHAESKAAAALIDAAEAGAECVLMEFGTEPEAYETPRLKCIGIPDECSIADILSRT